MVLKTIVVMAAALAGACTSHQAVTLNASIDDYGREVFDLAIPTDVWDHIAQGEPLGNNPVLGPRTHRQIKAIIQAAIDLGRGRICPSGGWEAQRVRIDDDGTHHIVGICLVPSQTI